MEMRQRVHVGLRDETRERATTSAMVFAPHPDDETLGCGGTVILKARAGAPVSIVFMTDGGSSHRGSMREEQMRSLRRTEAGNAAGILGIGPKDVHFLDLPDGGVKRCREDAVAGVLPLLHRYRPAEVYVPYRFDGTPDHESTHAVVVEALEKAGRRAGICEYPVWFWNRWPWVPTKYGSAGDGVRDIARDLWNFFARRRFREFRTGICIKDVLERKWEALAQHRTQTTVLVPGTAWPTIAEIADGEFLRCFFQEYEVFRCWSFPVREETPRKRREEH